MSTYTYTPPAAGVFADPNSEVRFLLGDTAPAAPDSLSDEEVGYLIATTADSDGTQHLRIAASEAAMRMAAKYDQRSHVASKSVSGLSLSFQWQTRATAMRTLAEELAKDATEDSAPTIVWAGSDGSDCSQGLDPFGQGWMDNGGGYGDVGWTEAQWR